MKRMILAALALSAALCCGCTAEQVPTVPPVESGPAHQTTPTEPSEPTVPETVPEETFAGDISVDTPCGTLYLPDEWDVPIRYTASGSEDVVLTFLAEDVQLYDLTFARSPAGAMGQVRTADGICYIGMYVHPLEEETDMLLSMQESVNILLSQLAPEPVSAVTAEPEQDIRLDTDYGRLYFPAKWKDRLKTQQPEQRLLEFHCSLPGHEPQLLFTALFGIGTDGPSAVLTAPDGTRTEVYILVAEPEFDGSWTAEETDIYYAMQEDMNYLLDAIRSGR